MFKIIGSILAGKQSGKVDTAEEISDRAKLAAASLLMEIAKSDDLFDDSEKELVVHILEKNFGLSGEDIIALLEEECENNVDLWHVTKAVNDNNSTKEKINIVELMWGVVYADGKLDKYEDYLMHKVGKLLHLTHKELIAAKITAKK